MSVRSLERNGCPILGTTRSDLVEADQRHDVADIDLRPRRDRHLPAVTCQARRNTPRAVSPTCSTISLNGPTMQVAGRYKHLEHLARDRTHDVLAFDLRSDHRRCRNDHRRWAGKQNLVACLQRCRRSPRCLPARRMRSTTARRPI